MSPALAVYWGTELVGRLEQDKNEALVFQYAPEWLSSSQRAAISLSLPLRLEPFTNNEAVPFFSNLLPEGGVRDLIAQRLGISDRNDFKLLEFLGGDCAGALSLHLPARKPGEDGSYELLSSEDLLQMITQMPQRPLLSPAEGLRLSLAGVQNKLPIFVQDGKFYLPRGARASSHILKPPIEKVEHSVENEVFCMTLAAELGLPTAKVQVWPASLPLFLTERYDRTRSPAGDLARLHQEDFCQALGYRPDRKYEAEDGPTLKMCFDLVARHAASPALAKQRLIQWVVFNSLIGNNDAHAKNISLMLGRNGIHLAPFYDLLSTAIYDTLHQKMAMKVGGENRPEWIMRRHWEKFAEDAGVAPRAVFGVCADLIKKWPAAFSATRDRLAKSPGNFSIVQIIGTHAEKMVRHLKAVLTEKS